MAIGAGWSDSWMLDMADCSIAIETEQRANRQNQIYNLSVRIGDIAINDFGCLKDLLMDDILALHEKIKYLTIAIFKFAVFYTSIQYFISLINVQILSDLFTAEQHISIYLASIFLITVFIMQGDYGTTLRIRLMRVYPIFYRFNKIHHFNWLKAHFIECMLISLVQALFLSILV